MLQLRNELTRGTGSGQRVHRLGNLWQQKKVLEEVLLELAEVRCNETLTAAQVRLGRLTDKAVCATRAKLGSIA